MGDHNDRTAREKGKARKPTGRAGEAGDEPQEAAAGKLHEAAGEAAGDVVGDAAGDAAHEGEGKRERVPGRRAGETAGEVKVKPGDAAKKMRAMYKR